MSRTTAIVIAVLLLLLVMWLAIWREGPVVEADLSERVELQLSQAGFSNIRVTADGQELTLTGSLTSEQQRQQVLTLAEEQWGVTVAHDNLQLLAPATAPSTTNTTEDALDDVVAEVMFEPVPATTSGRLVIDLSDALRVQGVVADSAAEQSLLQALVQQFPNRELLNELTTGADSAFVGPVAEPLIPQLALFETGRLTIADGEVQFTGELQTFEANAQLRSSLADWSDEQFALVIDVNAPQATEDSCQALFNDVLSLESIQFATNSADIDPVSLPLLNRLSSILNTCGFAVEIGGHTDSTGDDAYNQWLSERRAEAVSAYLIARVGTDQGSAVESSQIRAKGFGETQPVADNTTRSGRQANRRIEFMVRRQQP